MLSNTFKCYQTYVWHHILKKAFQLLKQRLKEVSLSLSLSQQSRRNYCTLPYHMGQQGMRTLWVLTYKTGGGLHRLSKMKGPDKLSICKYRVEWQFIPSQKTGLLPLFSIFVLHSLPLPSSYSIKRKFRYFRRDSKNSRQQYPENPCII